jgi:hypothetical protein
VTPTCETPIPDETLLDYWGGGDAADRDEGIDTHLFACGDCSARLIGLAALSEGVTALARQGRIFGLVSRTLINRLQRDGVCLRQYSLAPGDTVPCSVFPGDDLVVTSLRGDFSGAPALALSVTGLASARTVTDLPVSPSEGEVFFALPAAIVRELPSTRIEITLRSVRDAAEIGRYVLDHAAPA